MQVTQRLLLEDGAVSDDAVDAICERLPLPRLQELCVRDGMAYSPQPWMAPVAISSAVSRQNQVSAWSRWDRPPPIASPAGCCQRCAISRQGFLLMLKGTPRVHLCLVMRVTPPSESCALLLGNLPRTRALSPAGSLVSLHLQLVFESVTTWNAAQCWPSVGMHAPHLVHLQLALQCEPDTTLVQAATRWLASASCPLTHVGLRWTHTHAFTQALELNDAVDWMCACLRPTVSHLNVWWDRPLPGRQA